MYKTNPFGNPDGARADINEIDNSFFFNDFYAPETAIYIEDLLKKRFIIGTKGSGKTFYLRKIHALLRGRNTGVYVADEMEFTLSCTDKVVRFCNLTGRGIVTEQWKKLWAYSIYAHLITLYLFDMRMRNMNMRRLFGFSARKGCFMRECSCWRVGFWEKSCM